jgi:hypothetical protein
MEPVAIIGLAFSLSGGVEVASSSWDILENARNVMKEWPKNRANIRTIYKPGSGLQNTAGLTKALPLNLTWSLTNNQLYSKGGYFVDGDPGAFDVPFFSITAQGR